MKSLLIAILLIVSATAHAEADEIATRYVFGVRKEVVAAGGLEACRDAVHEISQGRGTGVFNVLKFGAIAAHLTPSAVEDVMKLDCITYVELIEAKFHPLPRVGRTN